MELYFQQKSEEVVKKYFLGFIKILLIVASIFLISDIFLVNSLGTAKILGSFCILLIPLFFFERMGINFNYTKQYFYTLLFSLLVFLTFVAGGPYSFALSWFLLIILINFKLSSTKSMIFWIVLTLVFYIIIGVLDYKKLIPQSIIQENVAFDNLLTLSLLLFSIAYFERMSKKVSILLKEQNEELLQKNINKSKLESIGVMASGMAHEINNPLAIINGYVGIIEKSIEKKNYSEISGISKALIIQTQKLDYIIKSLKKFSRDGSQEELAINNLSELIDEILLVYKSRLNSLGIKVFSKMDPSLDISCRSVEIGQVLINLINNSIDAIADFETRWISIQAKAEDDKCIILFKDSGFGIKSDIREKIFNPFFTTKPIGQGTGLGLSISQSIIRNHSGEIEVINGENTTFQITLPLVSPLDS